MSRASWTISRYKRSREASLFMPILILTVFGHITDNLINKLMKRRMNKMKLYMTEERWNDLKYVLDHQEDPDEEIYGHVELWNWVYVIHTCVQDGVVYPCITAVDTAENVCGDSIYLDNLGDTWMDAKMILHDVIREMWWSDDYSGNWNLL